jgi:hypothetical protein
MKPHHRQTLPFIVAMIVAVGCRWFGMNSGVPVSAFVGIFAYVIATRRLIAHVFSDTNLWMMIERYCSAMRVKGCNQGASWC